MSGPSVRLPALDAVRGVALLGILVVNLSHMTLPLVNSGLPGMGDPLDVVAWVPVKWAFETKFLVLFSLLFGMGAALQERSSERDDRAFKPMFRRRMLVLAGVGLLHAWLLWPGDILLHYAIVGLVLPELLSWSAGRRLRLAIAFIAGPWLLNVVLHGVVALVGEGSAAPVSIGVGPWWLEVMGLAGLDPRSPVFQAAEGWVHDHGSTTDVLLLRGGTWVGFQAVLLFTLQPLRTLGVFLIGAHLWQRGVFHERGRALRRGLIRYGLLGGLVAEAGVVALHFAAGFVELHPLAVCAEAIHGVSGLAVGLGLAGGLAAIGLHPTVGRAMAPLARVGRMALTNYLGHSVVGLALVGLLGFGTLHRIWHLPVALLVIATQVGLAMWWLSRFRMGPVEWVWRALTYGRLPPLLRSPQPSPQP